MEEEEEGNKIAEEEGNSVKICVWLVCWRNHLNVQFMNQ